MPEFSLFLIALIVSSVLLVIVIILLLTMPRYKAGKIIEEMMKNDKSIEQILEYGKIKRWDEKEIKMYFLLYTLEDFLDQGYNLHEIESMASDAGWPKEMIDIVISKIK